jgi:hypothetical protein
MASLHNFVKLYLSSGGDGLQQASELLALLKECGDKRVMFEVATKHFRRNASYTPLLAQALRFVLDSQEQTLDTVQDSFVRRSSVGKYILVCLLLTEVTSPLRESVESDKESVTANLLMRYQVSCDAIHKAVQALQEWYYPGKELLEQVEIIQNDTTQESHKSMLLYQVAELVQMVIMMKLKKVAGGEIEAAELKKFRSTASMIERVHQVNLDVENDLDAGFGFTLPQQMFKLQVPAFVNISASSNQLLQTYYGSSVEVKKDQNLLLRVHLSQNHG